MKIDIATLKQMIYVPFTEDELARYDENARTGVTLFEYMHGQNRTLFQPLVCLDKYKRGELPAPPPNFGSLFYPAHDPTANFSADIWRALETYLVEQDPGGVPVTDAFIFASRSTKTLISRLEALYPTGALVQADNAFKRLVRLVSAPPAKRRAGLSYADEVHEIVSDFVRGCEANAAALTEFLRDEYAKDPKLAASLHQRRGTPRFTHEQRTFAMLIWKRGTESEQVRRYARSPRIGYEDVYRLFAKDLAEVGILTCEQFRKCVQSARNEKNYLRAKAG